MTMKKQVVERRKHTRFHVRDGAFAVLGPYSSKIGQIIDMSIGGLAFSYIAGEERSNRSYELGILLAENSFYLTKIPFETIWDKETRGVPFSSVPMRRCGVQFGELTQNQASQLQYFIQNHTGGPAQHDQARHFFQMD
jgi:hypothetical protein